MYYFMMHGTMNLGIYTCEYFSCLNVGPYVGCGCLRVGFEENISTYNELNDLYSLPNIVRVVKWRRMRWEGQVARMGGGERNAQGVGGET
jgi:hypothetical protein